MEVLELDLTDNFITLSDLLNNDQLYSGLKHITALKITLDTLEELVLIKSMFPNLKNKINPC